MSSDPIDRLLDDLVELSRAYGADPQFVLAGGGNTSVKTEGRLWVKASGFALATITREGFAELDREKLQQLLDADLGPDPEQRERCFKQSVLDARVDPAKAQRPSVETLLHHLLPGRFVVHTHPTLVNAVTCCTTGESIARELLGDDALWVPYTDPGFTLALALRDALRDYTARTHRPCPPAILIQNHGLFVAGDSAEEIRKRTGTVMDRVRQRVGATPTEPFGPVQRVEPTLARTLIETLAPALRGLLGAADPAVAWASRPCVAGASRPCSQTASGAQQDDTGTANKAPSGEDHGQDARATEEARATQPPRDRLPIVTFDESPVILALAGASEGQRLALAGPVTPDHLVYCGSFPMWFEPVSEEAPSQTIERLRLAVRLHTEQYRLAPRVVLVKGLGAFCIGDDAASALTVRDLYRDAATVMAGAQTLGGIRPMADEHRKFIEDWEVEAYRRSVAAAAGRSAGRAAGKVAVVTGAAQGFGYEIATDLAAQSAHVALADINEGGVSKAAAKLAESHPHRAIGLVMNVTDEASIADALHQVVRTWGGVDLFVSNAGVLKAGSVKTQSLKDFDFVTRVNYTGYFLCVQKVAPILATQHSANAESWSDIIQINSKSGLEGSNRNGAYAGSKFGGIGLTQSFALELVEDGIKVNSICPGNFFDGPLWSDPENGLFVQYLRTGKVPGAQTIADVRRFYEAKVPMKRGTTTADVMKAVYYLMEQKYETGQAVPVTGGQVMLK